MSVDIGIALAVLGGIVGVLGWLSGREKSIRQQAQWQGEVNAKIDLIIGLQKDVKELEGTVKEYEGRLSKAEESAKSAHHRIDALPK